MILTTPLYLTIMAMIIETFRIPYYIFCEIMGLFFFFQEKFYKGNFQIIAPFMKALLGRVRINNLILIIAASLLYYCLI